MGTLWHKLILLAFVSVSVQAFGITKSEPKIAIVKEGDVLKLFCAVDGYYEWCTFRHKDRLCDFEWQREPWNVTVLECDDYEGRYRWYGDYNYYECGLELTGASLEDAGEWSCSFESYHRGQYRGYGYRANATMMVEVEAITTTTTTTTTTTMTTTYSAASSASRRRNDSPPTSEEEEEIVEVVDDEPKSSTNAGYVVLAVIIVILIIIAAIVYGLHYKGKLPPSFYNLSGYITRGRGNGNKRFKPVKSDVDEDDAKKHPTIVKNGTNGTADMGDDADINPDLTTVTWTSEKGDDKDAPVMDEEKKPLQEE